LTESVATFKQMSAILLLFISSFGIGLDLICFILRSDILGDM
jgi:hypothetical protein